MLNDNRLITGSHKKDFFERGYIVLSKFYDFDADIVPIQGGIRQILEMLCHKYGVEAPTDNARDAMTKGYQALIAKDRAHGGEVYDAVKQLPAFMQLIAKVENSDAYKLLYPESVPGVAAGGYGIRIDNPGEEKFRSQWHQEFPFQLRSIDGIVFWTPLLPVTPEMGPVQIAEASHHDGFVPVYKTDAGVGKTGAYQVHLDKADERIAKYKIAAPLTEPGDLILMDFLTIHQSGHNISSIPRWTIQFRYFNFADPVGQRINWAGSFTADVDLNKVISEIATTSRVQK